MNMEAPKPRHMWKKKKIQRSLNKIWPRRVFSPVVPCETDCLLSQDYSDLQFDHRPSFIRSLALITGKAHFLLISENTGDQAIIPTLLSHFLQFPGMCLRKILSYICSFYIWHEKYYLNIRVVNSNTEL